MSSSAPPSIAILNGTSRTGAHVAELALANGSEVHAIVRSARRLSSTLTEKPSSKFHVHELGNDLLDPYKLAPILKRVDFLILIFVQPMDKILDPTSLNTDAAVASVAAIRAGTDGGAPPRTKVMLLSAEIIHPDNDARFGKALLGEQMKDLERATAYLRTQAAWGLEWAALLPGRIGEAAPPESAATRAQGVRLTHDAHAIGGQIISYGRLGAGFVQATREWGRWKNSLVIPAPTGEKVQAPISDALRDVGSIIGAHARRMLKALAWNVGLVAVGWQVGVRLGDFGTGAWLRGLTAGSRA